LQASDGKVIGAFAFDSSPAGMAFDGGVGSKR
jgi:hypothetical protein